MDRTNASATSVFNWHAGRAAPRRNHTVVRENRSPQSWCQIQTRLRLPHRKEHVDGKGPALLHAHTIEIRDGVSANIHPIQHTGTGKRGIRIVVSKMARSLHLNNQECKFSDFIGEFGNVSSVGTLPPQPPVLQGLLGLSPSGFTARTFGTGHKQPNKQGVVDRTDCPGLLSAACHACEKPLP